MERSACRLEAWPVILSVVSVLVAGALSLEVADAAQSTEPPVPVYASGPIPLRGPDSVRAGDTVELCASSFAATSVRLAFELRDALRAGEVLNAAEIILAPGEGRCLSYQETLRARRVVGIVASHINGQWATAGHRSITVNTSVRDGSSNTVTLVEASAKVASFPSRLTGAPDAKLAPADREGHHVRPRPVHIAGPLPIDGALSDRAADVVELCATNVATGNVALTMAFLNMEDARRVLASREDVLGPGEGVCFPYREQDEASRRVLGIVSMSSGNTWSETRRSLLTTASIKDGTSNTVMVIETHPLVIQLPAVQ